MGEFLRAYPVRLGGEVVEEDFEAPVRFVASTEGRKRDGKDLRIEDWDLSRYSRLPTVLWAHDFMGHNLPLGRGEIVFDGPTMLIDVRYDTDDPFAMAVRRKARMGIVGASVSWDEVERDGRLVNELTEVSNVPIPLDPAAVPVRELEGLANLRSWLNVVVLGEGDEAPGDGDELGQVAAGTGGDRPGRAGPGDPEAGDADIGRLYRIFFPEGASDDE